MLPEVVGQERDILSLIYRSQISGLGDFLGKVSKQEAGGSDPNPPFLFLVCQNNSEVLKHVLKKGEVISDQF